jgi:hypothetical protein
LVILDEACSTLYRDVCEVVVAKLCRPQALVACAGFVAALFLAGACGGDDEAEEPPGEPCSLSGQIDANCLCSTDRPRGLRTCMANLIWGECACGEPFEQPCVEGEPVDCPPCEGESQGHTTTCLRAGTFDCGCDTRGARSAGAQTDASFGN